MKVSRLAFLIAMPITKVVKYIIISISFSRHYRYAFFIQI
jgi:hypothetical protein